ncbi:hypothetical protein CBM2599_B50985 [Cupriavidus taiwanensis]|nr:hypothetical protein CBM2600_B10005 [Cupriavidus taiwanensis]SOY97239.1 hypothetical protein CBM2599_B50985 [Cupriavidus taiwanensis]
MTIGEMVLDETTEKEQPTVAGMAPTSLLFKLPPRSPIDKYSNTLMRPPSACNNASMSGRQGNRARTAAPTSEHLGALISQ